MLHSNRHKHVSTHATGLTSQKHALWLRGGNVCGGFTGSGGVWRQAGWQGMRPGHRCGGHGVQGASLMSQCRGSIWCADPECSCQCVMCEGLGRGEGGKGVCIPAGRLYPPTPHTHTHTHSPPLPLPFSLLALKNKVTWLCPAQLMAPGNNWRVACCQARVQTSRIQCSESLLVPYDAHWVF